MFEKISTNDLVEELIQREGVDTIEVNPYEDKTISVNGPATILIVYD